MKHPKLAPIRIHEDPVMFREALTFTAAETAFSPRLIEKDYFCSVLLAYLAPISRVLVFKGGTCLAKVHAGFYRMSEDLDFVIPQPTEATRKERSAQVADLKTGVAALPRQQPAFKIVHPLTGANNSTQYISAVEYISHITRQPETIKLEIALREPLLEAAQEVSANTLLLNPMSGRPFVGPFRLNCISLLESFAEKFRAALSRREPAIRDFYDLDYAVRKLGLITDDTRLAALIRRKLAVPGNGPIDVTESRLNVLRRQIDAQLRPVLRTKDYAEFDLDRAFDFVAGMAVRVDSTPGTPQPD